MNLWKIRFAIVNLKDKIEYVIQYIKGTLNTKLLIQVFAATYFTYLQKHVNI